LPRNEQKYRQFVETLQDGIWAFDKHGHTTFVNTRMAEILGCTIEEIQGRNLFSFMNEHNVSLAKKSLDQCMRGTKEQHEFEFIKKDGTKIYTLTETSPLIDKDGNNIGVLAGVIDITKYKQAVTDEEKMREGMLFQDITNRINEEEQLIDSEERYQNLVELAPDSIVTLDLKGYITSCNSSSSRIFRYSKDDLKGKHFSKIGIFKANNIPKYLKIFTSILQGKGTGLYELTIYDKDGAQHSVETHIDLIKQNNKISGIIAITRDITEKKKSELALKESEEKYKRLFNSFPELIIETDDKGNILTLNPMMEKSLGAPAEKLIGKNIFDILPREIAEARAKTARKA
jgi:PAS domain S-box-containing protein